MNWHAFNNAKNQYSTQTEVITRNAILCVSTGLLLIEQIYTIHSGQVDRSALARSQSAYTLTTLNCDDCLCLFVSFVVCGLVVATRTSVWWTVGIGRLRDALCVVSLSFSLTEMVADPMLKLACRLLIHHLTSACASRACAHPGNWISSMPRCHRRRCRRRRLLHPSERHRWWSPDNPAI